MAPASGDTASHYRVSRQSVNLG